MALVKYGGGVASMSGKLGGTVAARNRYGAYFRNWAKPTNEPTASQTARRADFAAQSAAWQSLTETERKAWEDWAAGLTLLNRQGDSYIPTGRQMFISVNTNIVLGGGTPITAPPVGEVAPAIDPADSITVNIDGGNIVGFVYTEVGDVSGAIILLFGAPEQTGGKQNLTTLYRFIGSKDYDGTGQNIAALYTAVFGTAGTEGAVMKMKARVVDKFTGLSSPFLIIETVNLGP